MFSRVKAVHSLGRGKPRARALFLPMATAARPGTPEDVLETGRLAQSLSLLVTRSADSDAENRGSPPNWRAAAVSATSLAADERAERRDSLPTGVRLLVMSFR
jgi:hypothetical protein